jgi:hypothetical protein
VSTSPQYEFTHEQNTLIADLAGKMKFVGFFSALFGLFALLITALTVTFIFRDRLPAGFRAKAGDWIQKAKEKLPEDLQKQAEEYAVNKIPTDNNFVTGVAIFSGVTGLIFLLQGVWARSSAAAFRKIVDTKGNDVTHLMHALGSLRSMYSMIYLLLVLALLAGLVALGVTLYHSFYPQ